MDIVKSSLQITKLNANLTRASVLNSLGSRKNGVEIVSHNRFLAFAQLDSNVYVLRTEAETAIIDIMNNFKKDPLFKNKKTQRLSSKTLKLIKKRQHIFKNNKNSPELTELYSELKQKTIKSIKKDKKKQHLKSIEETSQDFISNKSKKLWSWIKNRIGRGFASISNDPVLDTDGNLIIEQNQKLLVWAKHFEGLAENSTGNSRVSTKWQNIWGPSMDTLPECNDSITWEEIKIALKATPNNKAAGIYGLPSEYDTPSEPNRAQVQFTEAIKINTNFDQPKPISSNLTSVDNSVIKVFKREPNPDIVLDASDIDFGSDYICPSSPPVVEMMDSNYGTVDGTTKKLNKPKLKTAKFIKENNVKSEEYPSQSKNTLKLAHFGPGFLQNLENQDKNSQKNELVEESKSAQNTPNNSNKKLICWNIDELSTESVKKAAKVHTSIKTELNISKKKQANGKYRFEITKKHQNQPFLQNKDIKKISRAIRSHIIFDLPKHMYTNNIKNHKLVSQKLSVQTYNIRGLRGSKLEFAHFLAKKQPLIICLQETLLTKKSYRCILAGYTAIEQKSDLTCGGNDLLVEIKEKIGLNIILINVHIPSSGIRKKKRLKSTNNKIKCKSNSGISIKLTGIKEKWCRDW
ncbi:hypothetical protein BB561_003076 [Smittium simulii]|uniref:Endonuclease/exonuclease/phosphatase domain-containing protein n=1 Tax=Smittium simulii TaxID=133385 RepID=A0A2T9YN15_9FUNG|nr:hypothetical protein BB561_003076 [Smittium simulii]